MEIASKYILGSAVNKELVREGQDDGQNVACGAETVRVSQERRDGVRGDMALCKGTVCSVGNAKLCATRGECK